MLNYVEIAGVDVSSYVTKWSCYDEWKIAISEITIEMSPAVTDAVTIAEGQIVIVKRGFVAVTEDFVFEGQITQRKPEAAKIILVCKGKMYEAIKAGRTKSWDKDIDTEAGVGSEIFKSILTHSGLTYSSTTIISTGTTNVYRKFIQNDEDDYQKLNEIANDFDYIMYRDNTTGYVHFEPKGYTIYPHTLVVGTDIPKQIKWKHNMEQLINKVKIYGATVYDTIFETFAGPDDEFTLSKTPEDTEVRVGGSAGTLQVRGQKDVGVIGTDFDYYIDVENKKIVFSANQSNVWIRYGAQVPMPIVLSDLTSINTYGGPDKTSHFKRFDFTNLKDVNDAETRGRAILKKYSTPFIEAQEVPVIDSTIQTYGFIKPGMLVTIQDSFTGESNTVFVKIVKKAYPYVNDEITVGDEIWRTEDWQAKQMEKINSLFNELNKNQDILITVFDFSKEMALEKRYFMLQKQNIAGSVLVYNNPTFGTWNSFNWGSTSGAGFILGHSIFGILGTSTLGGAASSPVITRVLQGNDTYKEYFYDTDFKGSTCTADWDTTNRKLRMSSSSSHTTIYNTLCISSAIDYNNGEISSIVPSWTETKWSAQEIVEVYFSADGGTNWQQATNGSSLTFTVQGHKLMWKAYFVGNGGSSTYIENLQAVITHVT